MVFGGKLKQLIIHSRAPTRIDLAGGTVDIWPLYLFLKKPVTLNLGIDLYAEATLEFTPAPASRKGRVILGARDQKIQLEKSWDSIQNETDAPSTLELHFKLLKYFVDQMVERGYSDWNWDLTLITQAKSPAGAGLGGSSALSIAMIGALATWTSDIRGEGPIDPLRDGQNFIDIVRDVETTVICVPAGLQDYYGAMYGGLQSLNWGAGVHHRQWLPEDLISELENRLLLFYSGRSRNSGINNWAMFKSFIDREGDIQTKFGKINEATQNLQKALLKRDWTQVGLAIREEWQTRKTLASGITTPEIDRAFSEAAKLAPIAGKICGAGGGGCFFIYVPDVDAKAKVQAKVIDQGVDFLPFYATRKGLEVTVSR